MSKRRISSFVSGLSLVILSLMYNNCSKTGFSPQADSASSSGGGSSGTSGVGDVGTWNLPSAFSFVQGSSTSVDLSATLPTGVTGVKTGGIFSVDPSGAQLPSGMTLSANGVLSVGTASASSIAGVIFVYTEP